MDLPDRDANQDDPILYPHRDDPRSANGSYSNAEWLRWRLTDPQLAPSLRVIMTVEASEAEHLGRLLEALDNTPGETLEEKMRIPEHRDALKALALRWLRAQAAVIEVATAAVDHKVSGNGNGN